MLCLTVSLLFFMLTCTDASNVGTTIFYNKHARGECWSQDEVAKLRARKLFQGTMPKQVTPDKVDSQFIKDALRFYRGAMQAAQSNTDYHTGMILKQALADTIGGHLRNEMLPTIRFAYYAGYVPYKNVRDIHDYLENTKAFLNTRGMGWKQAEQVPQWSNLTVVKILIGSGKLFDPCACLVTKRDSNACIHLPSPKLDDNNEPTSIALPFKIGGLVSLTSPDSENILLKYYTTAARCILRTSSESCRHSDFVNFNNELWHWMKRDVAPHLLDEKLYVAYGGVLRIAAAVQGYGRGLSRRNLFESYQVAGVAKWHPWQALTQSYVYLNADWTPKLYVGMVFVAALVICLLQICYNYTFGDSKGCHCTGRKRSWTRDVNYATVDTTFPSMLPSHHSSDMTRQRQPGSKTRSSLVSVKTQRVYDFNENTEKLMEVIMSGNENSETDSPSLSKQEESEEAGHVINLGQSKRQKGPPELHTPVAQLRIEKKPRDAKSLQMYTTSTATHSDVTYCQEQRASESVWSESASTSSAHSASTDSSKTPPSRGSRRSRGSRDLAWARRVASKHALPDATRSTTGTEFDRNSFTTPPSRR